MRVLLDGEDGTVTLSRGLLMAMSVLAADDEAWGKVHVFTVSAGHRLPCGYDKYYCFSLDPSGVKGLDTNYYEVQYNGHYRTLGFYPTCPTVARIMYDYGYAHLRHVILRVRMENARGLVYFRVIPESKAAYEEKEV